MRLADTMISKEDRKAEIVLRSALSQIGSALRDHGLYIAIDPERNYSVAPLQPGVPAHRAGMEAAMEIIGRMRQSEAGLLDPAHSGQRGEDRSTALYDAYHAIRKALPAGHATMPDPLASSPWQPGEQTRPGSHATYGSEFVRAAAMCRGQAIEAAIERFRDCGVALARFSIQERGDVTHLCVDGISRFTFLIRWPDLDSTPTTAEQAEDLSRRAT